MKKPHGWSMNFAHADEHLREQPTRVELEKQAAPMVRSADLPPARPRWMERDEVVGL